MSKKKKLSKRYIYPRRDSREQNDGATPEQLKTKCCGLSLEKAAGRKRKLSIQKNKAKNALKIAGPATLPYASNGR